MSRAAWWLVGGSLEKKTTRARESRETRIDVIPSVEIIKLCKFAKEFCFTQVLFQHSAVGHGRQVDFTT